ncbi:hypothetical protein HZS_7609 [Henneguya salminicola]|nr:hypothetical protein HZS_7609 [Henneguya salminicola]
MENDIKNKRPIPACHFKMENKLNFIVNYPQANSLCNNYREKKFNGEEFYSGTLDAATHKKQRLIYHF